MWMMILLTFILELLIFICTHIYILISINFLEYVLIYVCSSQYLTELLAERQKLGPFMQVLPLCTRLLNQGPFIPYQCIQVFYCEFSPLSFQLISIVSFELGHVMAKLVFWLYVLVFQCSFSSKVLNCGRSFVAFLNIVRNCGQMRPMHPQLWL